MLIASVDVVRFAKGDELTVEIVSVRNEGSGKGLSLHCKIKITTLNQTNEII